MTVVSAVYHPQSKAIRGSVSTTALEIAEEMFWSSHRLSCFTENTFIVCLISAVFLSHPHRHEQGLKERHLLTHSPASPGRLRLKSHCSPFWLSQGNLSVQGSPRCRAHTWQHRQPSSTRGTPGGHWGAGPGQLQGWSQSWQKTWGVHRNRWYNIYLQWTLLSSQNPLDIFLKAIIWAKCSSFYIMKPVSKVLQFTFPSQHQSKN